MDSSLPGSILFRMCTFDKELRGAFLLSHHTGVRSIVRQGAVFDRQVAHVANTLKDVPAQFTRTTTVVVYLHVSCAFND